MEILTIITSRASGTHLMWRNAAIPGGRNRCQLHGGKIFRSKLHSVFGANIKSFASRNYVKKLRREDGEVQKSRTRQNNKNSSDEYVRMIDRSSPRGDFIVDNSGVSSVDNLDAENKIASPSRGAVLQACTVTSGLIFALGLVIRQASHFAFLEGWPVLDCSTGVSFNFEMWHLELIIGLVILISSCRYLLLQTWPDFAESSEAANQQVLSSLQPLDYMVISFLPGISEEFLFRGVLLPIFGLNWKSALVVAAIFGILHLGSGRRYSFAVWATFVGFTYGYATIVSSSIIVPMASHALNNLVGGILWRYLSASPDEK